MSMVDIIGYFAMAGIFFGNIYIAKKNVLGMWLMLAGNICWLTVGYSAEVTSLIVASYLFMSVNIYGIVKWSKKDTFVERVAEVYDQIMPTHDISKLIEYAHRYLNGRLHWHEFVPGAHCCTWCGMSDGEYSFLIETGTDGGNRPICTGNEVRKLARWDLIQKLTVEFDGFHPRPFEGLFSNVPTYELREAFEKAKLDVVNYGSLYRTNIGPRIK